MQAHVLKSTLCAALLLVTLSLPAQTVTQPQALEEARQFLMSAPGGKAMAGGIGRNNRSLSLSLVKEGLTPVSQKPAYYVFSGGEEEGSGFVIVSGDERTSHRILGYSANGTFGAGQLPANVQAWLDGYAGEVETLTQKTNAVVNEGSGWEEAVGNVVVAPLIKTQWGQTEPFNDKCPTRKGERTIVGCVAVAAGQVMNYYRWPLKGQGHVQYEWSTSDIDVDFSQSTYDYDNLDVAQFLFEVAAASQMDFNVDGSGTYERDAAIGMMRYFDYDKSMQIHYRYHKNEDYYNERVLQWPDDEWDDMLRRELDARRPILYGGAYREDGHEFVCDGYDDAGYFHFNWGWDGFCDGWFITSSLFPTDMDNKNAFNNEQSVVIGIKPNEDGELWIGTSARYRFVWGLADDVEVRYCMENDETHEKFYGNANTYHLTSLYSHAMYGNIPTDFPDKSRMKPGAYRKYLVCNVAGSTNYQPVMYAYANYKAEDDETFTWVDVTNDGKWTESSSRKFDVQLDEKTTESFLILNDNEVRLTSLNLMWGADQSPVVDSIVTYRGKEYVVTEAHLWTDCTPFYPSTIKKMTLESRPATSPSLPPCVEDLTLRYDGTEPINFPATVRVLSLGLVSNTSTGYQGTELTLPPHLEVLTHLAASQITEITIPASVRQLPNSDPQNGEPSGYFNVRNAKKIIFEEGSQLKTIPAGCFYGANALTKITLPEGLESIESGAFGSCQKLVAVTLPRSLKRMSGCFTICSALEEVYLPDDSQLEVIDGMTFDFCPELWHFDFPATLKVLTGGPFEEAGITTADLSRTQLTEVSGFRKCSKLKSVILPPTLRAIGYLYTGKATSLVVPEGVETIQELTGESIKSLKLPSTLRTVNATTLAAGADVYCEATTPPEGMGLTCQGSSGRTYRNINLYVPAGAKEAYQNYHYRLENRYGTDDYAYRMPIIEMVNTTTSVNMTLDEVGYVTVVGDADVDSTLCIPSVVSTPDGDAPVSAIAPWAFYGCSGLVEVDIPSSVGVWPPATRGSYSPEIGQGAFAYTPNLRKVIVHWDEPIDLSADVFEGDDLSTMELVVPGASIDAYRTADVWKKFGTITPSDIPEGIDDVTLDDVPSASARRVNLLGHQVDKAYRGIVVVNGKKMLIMK